MACVDLSINATSRAAREHRTRLVYSNVNVRSQDTIDTCVGGPTQAITPELCSWMMSIISVMVELRMAMEVYPTICMLEVLKSSDTMWKED